MGDESALSYCQISRAFSAILVRSNKARGGPGLLKKSGDPAAVPGEAGAFSRRGAGQAYTVEKIVVGSVDTLCIWKAIACSTFGLVLVGSPRLREPSVLFEKIKKKIVRDYYYGWRRRGLAPPLDVEACDALHEAADYFDVQMTGPRIARRSRSMRCDQRLRLNPRSSWMRQQDNRHTGICHMPY
jgi:hypothetical protein